MDAPFDPGGPRPGLDISPARWPDVSRVFAAAVELDSSARGGYLNEACSGDPELRSAVESLLAAHINAGSFGDTIPFPSLTTAKRLAPGSQLGTFRVDTLLGAGGMGEVYRAYDAKLARAVALKVLPDSLAGDADRRGRFEEEARALAALNHPHIGAIYGVEDSGDVAALVLELVDGITLAERLAAGPMPVDDVVRIARQLADGLEAAHDRGIVHRDFKPANIKITPDGNVKILDFGLAKVEGWAARASSPETQSPASSRRATVVGAIVGTAAYMSPEQARGQAVDKRADIWAFGCVLFEMCATGSPFSGSTVQEIRTAVIERDPEWQRLRSGTPPALERLLRRCLIKDPKQRLRDIGEARIALAPGRDLYDAAIQPASSGPAMSVIAAALVLTSLLTVGWLYRSREGTPALQPLLEFEVSPPASGVFRFHPGRTVVALSPDGLRLAYAAAAAASDERTTRIWIRERSSAQARALKGTEGAAGFFWSPDGRSLAFMAAGKLNRFDLPDGPAVPIADVPYWGFAHGTWGAGGVILLGLGSGRTIESISVADGARRVLLSADDKNREARLHWPWFLPDGNRFLFTARLEDGEGELRIGQLDGRWRRIMRMTSNAQFVAPNLVVFAREGVLMSQRVDLDAARPTGDPVPIAEPVEYFWTTGRGEFSASLAGDIAYHPGGDLQQLLWADLTGTPVGRVSSVGNYYPSSGRLNHADTALLTARLRPGLGTADIWRHDLVHGPEDRLTDGIGSELAPVWADDGRGIYHSADIRGAVPQLVYRDLATGQQKQLLPQGSSQQHPMDVFPDDGSLIYGEVVDDQRFQMFKLPTRPPGPPIPFLHGVKGAWDLRLSSTGRALSFITTENGARMLYVASADGVSLPVPVAENVATSARWNRDGTRIYFVGGDDVMMTATVRTVTGLQVDPPRPLFKVRRQTTVIDVAKDGRLLLLEPQVLAVERPAIVKLNALGSARR